MKRNEEWDKQWAEVMALAERYNLIIQAYGGVATLAHPEEQHKAGIRTRTLCACRRGGTFAEAEQIAAEEVR